MVHVLCCLSWDLPNLRVSILPSVGKGVFAISLGSMTESEANGLFVK